MKVWSRDQAEKSLISKLNENRALLITFLFGLQYFTENKIMKAHIIN